MADQNKIIHKDLSYKIVGVAFRSFKATGYGMPEKYCQGVFAAELEKAGLHFNREVYVTLNYEGKVITKYFLDFIVEDSVVVELKVRPKIGYAHIEQVMAYLKATNKKLAILIYFTQEGVKYRRIVNSYNKLQ
ncbi:MAG: GxxExxY protein [Candidatus Doudnabacteria bacterium]|nr:GxxExxY protein [Candidatus Doudnabacteria bacterium]